MVTIKRINKETGEVIKTYEFAESGFDVENKGDIFKIELSLI